MATVRLSGLISSIRGSINGSTFRDNNGQITLQNKSYGKKSSTSAQINNKNGFADIKNTWNALSEADYDEWVAYSSVTFFRQKNNYYKSISPENLFMKINRPRAINQIALLLKAPFSQTVPQAFSVSLFLDAGTLNVLIDRSIGAGVEMLILKTSFLVGHTITKPSSICKSLNVGSIVGTGGDITTEYTAKFGRIPDVGETIFFIYALQNIATGSMSNETISKITF